LRDLCSGKRKIIKCDEVKVIQLPYYEGLSVEEMVAFAEDHNNGKAMLALPATMKEVLKMPRAYIANVIHTVLG